LPKTNISAGTKLPGPITYGGIPYLPESFYLDKEGKVILTAADASSKEEIEANIRKLLGIAVK